MQTPLNDAGVVTFTIRENERGASGGRREERRRGRRDEGGRGGRGERAGTDCGGTKLIGLGKENRKILLPGLHGD